MATFRFYEELNDFLAPERRRREFDCSLAEGASVKHMIEALGVPHTEVELILVNGTSVGFEHALAEDDRVAVYPRFEALDITPLLRVRERPLRLTSRSPGRPKNDLAPSGGGSDVVSEPGAQYPRFVADAHLGGLARLLRMAGFDTLYDNHFADDAIVAIAAQEARVILSRDRELLKRREVTHGCYVHALEPRRQMQEIIRRLDLAAAARPFSLCLHCNAPLQALDAAAARLRVPPTVRELHEHFSTCEVCGRIFWEGSHWRRMGAVLREVLTGE